MLHILWSIAVGFLADFLARAVYPGAIWNRNDSLEISY
jgi:hypothetical protein